MKETFIIDICGRQHAATIGVTRQRGRLLWYNITIADVKTGEIIEPSGHTDNVIDNKVRNLYGRTEAVNVTERYKQPELFPV